MTRDEILMAIRDADPEALPGWVTVCAAGQALALMRLAQTQSPVSLGAPGAERMHRNLCASEAAIRIGVSTDYLYKQVKAGRLPFALRIGGRVLFDEPGLELWIRQRRVR